MKPAAQAKGLTLAGHVDLPEHVAKGGFDHAAVHRRTGRCYVAHTINDAVDVIDCATDRYLHSIPNLKGVAGALVSDEHDLVFTTNRGEDTAGIFSPDKDQEVAKLPVGHRPNGAAYDPKRGLLLAATIGTAEDPAACVLTLIDVKARKRLRDLPTPAQPGKPRTRWVIFDPATDAFYVNFGEPAQVLVVDAKDPTRIAQSFPIPCEGPHGLDLDAEHHRLFCACDGGKLYTVSLPSGEVKEAGTLSGVPDVIFLDPALHLLFVAVGNPGAVDVFDTRTLAKVQTVETERGAHTTALDLDRHKLYVFLPSTHRAAVYHARA